MTITVTDMFCGAGGVVRDANTPPPTLKESLVILDAVTGLHFDRVEGRK